MVKSKVEDRETSENDRIVTNECALPPEIMDCLRSLSKRSMSPIVVSAESEHSLQLHGDFKMESEPNAHLDFAKYVLRCLSGDKDLAIAAADISAELDKTDLGFIQFELLFQGVPVYHGGVSMIVSAEGVVNSVIVILPRDTPVSGKWGSENDAEKMLRKRWPLHDVSKEWPLQAGRKMWYSSSLVHGSVDDDIWKPVWVFHSKKNLQNSFDVIVSGDGAELVDAFIVKDEAGFAPVPRYHVSEATGVPDFVSWGQTGLLLPEAATGDPVRVCRALFDRYPKIFGTGDSQKQLVFSRTDMSTGSPHTYHVIFKQIFASIPVHGCQLRIHLSPSLAIRSITGNYLRDPQVSLDTPIPEQRAMQMLILATAMGDDRQTLTANNMQSLGLVVFPATLAPGGGSINYLAWRILTPLYDYFVSVESGRILYKIATRKHARLVYDANQMTSNETLDVRDGNIVSPSGTIDADSGPVDAFISSFEGFLLSNFGWRSWDNHSSDDIGVVDYPGNNASWSRYDHRMRFGRDFTSAEIVGHEFTHGIVETRCGLEYIGESGALDESFADVMGKFGFPGSIPNWILATLTKPVRDMSKDDPWKYSQLNNFPLDHFSVHSNCLIGDRCAVHVCDGDKNIPRPGIGRELTARLWFDVMTRMHPWATYLDFSHAMRETVRDLVGTLGAAVPASGSASGGPRPAFNAASVAQVDWALDLAELDPSLHSGWFTIPGNFMETQPFFMGETLPSNQIVAEAELLITRHRNADKTQFFSGRALAPTSPVFVDQSGTIRVAITTNGVGTRSKGFLAEITNIGGVELEIDGIIHPSTVPGTPPPTISKFTSTHISHWFSNPLFLGRKYGDLLFLPLAGPTAGCTLSAVWAELLEFQNGLLVPQKQTRVGQPAAVLNGTGLVLAEAGIVTTSSTPLVPVPFFLAKVRSWHEFGQSVRYRIKIEFSGGCTGTSLRILPVDPFTFK